MPARHIDDTRRRCLAFLNDPKLLDRRPSSPSLRTRQNRNLAHVCSFACKSISKLSQAKLPPGRRPSPEGYGDFGTDPRCWCVKGKQAVSSTANLGRRQGQPANCTPTVYRKPFSRRKAVGVTPIHFRNTRFSWVAPLNPTASATSAIDRSLSDNISFATLIRSDRTY